MMSDLCWVSLYIFGPVETLQNVIIHDVIQILMKDYYISCTLIYSHMALNWRTKIEAA